MNGIIHNCTHNESDSATFRMTEDKMFIAIFNYIEHLFGKIQPKKLFFMAIDGVAPRAKMNQQRARRFRTALDAERAKEKALREGVEMPKEEAFDSNCITPGTEFMAKLTKQLKYFISKKITEDADWQGVEIVLSGHEVPGEGEHKIMEYIRLAKAQPGYDANIRHCLYGLDADLIMLGLLSHDPHFSLLREEVTFGRASHKKSKELEHQNFYLMHLCIVREYLELEFQELKEPSALGFPYDMERVIDDFILMAFFVGNDFLPNLPNLHINEGALALMFKVYKSVLPKAGGYINEEGVINMGRLELLLDELSDVEYRFFESEIANESWFKGKQMAKIDVMEKDRKEKKRNAPMSMTSAHKDIFKQVKQFVNTKSADNHSSKTSFDLPSSLNARDRKFVQELAEDLHLQWRTVVEDNEDRHMQLEFPSKLEGDEDDEDVKDEEASIALNRVLKRYDNAKVVDITAEEIQEQMDKKYEENFQVWKDKYYKSKFEWGVEDELEMRRLTENYVQGLQWVLYYYYRGVVSWPWFYGYHYSPMISDVKNGLKANVNFRLGQPFRPYQQLMGVLPDRSKTIVPTAYHDLMTNPKSPIIDFYPRDFELDMNGKKMEWEAVVKIPFIDEDRLLPAMATKDFLLSQEERDRNEFGVSLKFTYAPEIVYTYPSSLTGIFPDIPYCHCVENTFDLPTMEGLDYHIGLMRGVMLGESALAGFPSLKTLPHAGNLGFHGVNVFQQDSRNESMIITMLDAEAQTKVESAKALLGCKIHVGYPFLSEAKVVRISDELFNYSLPPNGTGPPVAAPHGPQEIDMWRRKAERIESVYSKRLGMIIGEVQSMVHVETLKGLKKTDDGATVKEYAQVEGIETDYASQMVVKRVTNEDPRFLEQPALSVEEEFPVGSRAFFLGEFNYGRPLEVVGHTNNKADVWVSTVAAKVPEFGRQVAADADRLSPYSPSFAVAKALGLNALVLSKITSSFQVMLEDSRLNLGLNLKFDAKKLKVLGYSRRNERGWEYSEKAVQLIQQYMIKFPDFIAAIQRNSQGNIYNATDLFPHSDAKARIKDIQAWLKEIESRNFEKVPLDAEQLDSEMVFKIEQAANEAFQLDPPGKGVNKKINGAPRNALLKPSDAEQRLDHQRFRLGDRVVYVQDSGRVPIATRGTVVGKTRTPRTTMLDVVFDVTFMSGTSLEGRCSPFRGSTVPFYSVLNLSDPQFIAGSRASQQNRSQPQTQPLTSAGYGAPLGPNGSGQLIPAQIPGPLRGSFRGALSGDANGARGRGSARGRGMQSYPNGQFGPQNQQQTLPVRNQLSNQQVNDSRGRGSQQGGAPSRGRGNVAQLTPNGYTKLDNGDSNGDVVQNRNFRPKSYNNAPPPADLDARGGRGRGRGGPRVGPPSRGTFPRGRGGPSRDRASAVIVQQP
ncbi:exonuclease II Exo2 [Lecanora helva]